MNSLIRFALNLFLCGKGFVGVDFHLNLFLGDVVLNDKNNDVVRIDTGRPFVWDSTDEVAATDSFEYMDPEKIKSIVKKNSKLEKILKREPLDRFFRSLNGVIFLTLCVVVCTVVCYVAYFVDKSMRASHERDQVILEGQKSLKNEQEKLKNQQEKLKEEHLTLKEDSKKSDRTMKNRTNILRRTSRKNEKAINENKEVFNRALLRGKCRNCKKDILIDKKKHLNINGSEHNCPKN